MERPKRRCANVLPVKGVANYRKWLEPEDEMETWLMDAKRHQNGSCSEANSFDLLHRAFNFLIHFYDKSDWCYKFLAAVYWASKQVDFRKVIRDGMCKSGRLHDVVTHLLNENCGPLSVAENAMKTDDGIALLTDLAVSLVIGRRDDDQLTKVAQQQKLRNAVGLIVNYSDNQDRKQATRLVVDRLWALSYGYMIPELSRAIVSESIASKAEDPCTPVPQKSEEESILALSLTYERNQDGSIKPLSLQQLEEFILTCTQPFLQAKMALAWISLYPEDPPAKSVFCSLAMAAISAFEKEWPLYLASCTSSHQLIVCDLIESTTELVERVGYAVSYDVDKSTEPDFEGKEFYSRHLAESLWEKDPKNLNDFDNLGGFTPKFPRMRAMRFTPHDEAAPSGTQQLQAAAEKTPEPPQSKAQCARQDGAGRSKKLTRQPKRKFQNTAKRRIPFPKMSKAALASKSPNCPASNSKETGAVHLDKQLTGVASVRLERVHLEPNVIYKVYTDLEGLDSANEPVTFVMPMMSSDESNARGSNPVPAAALPSFAQLASGLPEPPASQQLTPFEQVCPSDYLVLEYGPIVSEEGALLLVSEDGPSVDLTEEAEQPQVTSPALEAQNSAEQHDIAEDGDDEAAPSTDSNKAAETAPAEEEHQAGPSHVDQAAEHECAHTSQHQSGKENEAAEKAETTVASSNEDTEVEAEVSINPEADAVCEPDAALESASGAPASTDDLIDPTVANTTTGALASSISQSDPAAPPYTSMIMEQPLESALGGGEPLPRDKESQVFQPHSSVLSGQIAPDATAVDLIQHGTSQMTACSALSAVAPLAHHSTQQQQQKVAEKNAECGRSSGLDKGQKENAEPYCLSASDPGQDTATELQVVARNTQQIDGRKKVLKEVNAVLTTNNAFANATHCSDVVDLSLPRTVDQFYAGASSTCLDAIDLTMPALNHQQTDAHQEVLRAGENPTCIEPLDLTVPSLKQFDAAVLTTSRDTNGVISICDEVLDLSLPTTVATAIAQNNQQPPEDKQPKPVAASKSQTADAKLSRGSSDVAVAVAVRTVASSGSSGNQISSKKTATASSSRKANTSSGVKKKAPRACTKAVALALKRIKRVLLEKPSTSSSNQATVPLKTSGPNTVTAGSRLQQQTAKEKPSSQRPKKPSAVTEVSAAAAGSNVSVGSSAESQEGTADADEQQQDPPFQSLITKRRASILTGEERQRFHNHSAMIETLQHRRNQQNTVQPKKGWWASVKEKVRSVLGMDTNTAHEPSPVPPANTSPDTVFEVVDLAGDDEEVEQEHGQVFDWNMVMTEDEDDDVPPALAKRMALDVSSDEDDRGYVVQAVVSTQHLAERVCRPRPSRSRKRRQQPALPSPSASGAHCSTRQSRKRPKSAGTERLMDGDEQPATKKRLISAT